MKLAEALILRADAQSRIAQLKQRLFQNAKVQEGERPAEEPRGLMAELDRLYAEVNNLVVQINRTNMQTAFDGEISLADGLARRDVLGNQAATYRELAQNAMVVHDRYTHTEIRYTSTVDVAAAQLRADELYQARRELDTRIQELNWTTELVE